MTRIKYPNSEFGQEMCFEDLQQGEILHKEYEKYRKLLLGASLTKNSNDIEGSLNRNPELFVDTLKLGIDTIEHYKDINVLLNLSVARLYSVISESEYISGVPEEIKEQISKLLNCEHQDIQ